MFGLIFITGVLLVIGASATSEKEEIRLVSHLLSTTHPHARPVKNVEDDVEVKFGISILDLNLNEKAEALETNAWFNLEWSSPSLSWNESEYSGIKSVRLPVNKIWTPDVRLYNMKGEETLTKTNAVVYSDGSVSYLPIVRASTACTIDMEYFPYDRQVCIIKAGSWTYDGSKLNLTTRGKSADLSIYSPNKGWNLIEAPAVRNVKLYDCCPEPYIDITFKIYLQRRPSFYTYTYIGPVVILSFLASTIFVLPPDNPQKMTIGGAILICYSLFYLDVSYSLPPIHLAVPLIVKYYMAMFLMLVVSICLGAVGANLARRTHSQRHPPTIMVKVILGLLGRVLCISRGQQKYTNISNGVDMADNSTEVKLESGGPGTSPGSSGAHQQDGVNEWYNMARVIDRLCFIVYLVLTVILTFCILMAYPRN